MSDSFGSEKGTIFSCVCGGTTRKPVLFESQSTYTDNKLQTHLWLGWDYGHCVSNSCRSMLTQTLKITPMSKLEMGADLWRWHDKSSRRVLKRREINCDGVIMNFWCLPSHTGWMWKSHRRNRYDFISDDMSVGSSLFLMNIASFLIYIYYWKYQSTKINCKEARNK